MQLGIYFVQIHLSDNVGTIMGRVCTWRKLMFGHLRMDSHMQNLSDVVEKTLLEKKNVFMDIWLTYFGFSVFTDLF